MMMMLLLGGGLVFIFLSFPSFLLITLKKSPLQEDEAFQNTKPPLNPHLEEEGKAPKHYFYKNS